MNKKELRKFQRLLFLSNECIYISTNINNILNELNILENEFKREYIIKFMNNEISKEEFFINLLKMSNFHNNVYDRVMLLDKNFGLRLRELNEESKDFNFSFKVKSIKNEKKIIGNYSHREFCILTRLMFDDILPKYCEECGRIDNLNIHHKKYVLPIVREDLLRLCGSCHSILHQRLRRDKKEKELDL